MFRTIILWQSGAGAGLNSDDCRVWRWTNRGWNATILPDPDEHRLDNGLEPRGHSSGNRGRWHSWHRLLLRTGHANGRESDIKTRKAVAAGPGYHRGFVRPPRRGTERQDRRGRA